VVAEVKIEESCIYTLTPDRNPVIDIMPGTNNIVIAAGFSGHKTTLTLCSEGRAEIEDCLAGVPVSVFCIHNPNLLSYISCSNYRMKIFFLFPKML
jgi:hypothetical protein